MLTIFLNVFFTCFVIQFYCVVLFAAAYKHADGRKIDGRRVVVDVERGRTVKGWRPRRLGGGLGSTRKGGPEVNSKYSGRDEGRSRSRSRDPSRRLSLDRDRDRRKRSRSREKRRRSRSRSIKKEDRGGTRSSLPASCTSRALAHFVPFFYCFLFANRTASTQESFSSPLT